MIPDQGGLENREATTSSVRKTLPPQAGSVGSSFSSLRWVILRGAAFLFIFGVVTMLLGFTAEIFFSFKTYEGSFTYYSFVLHQPIGRILLLAFGAIQGVVFAAIGTPILAFTFWHANASDLSKAAIRRRVRLAVGATGIAPLVFVTLAYAVTGNEATFAWMIYLSPLVISPPIAFIVGPWIAGARST